jgi:hypothetical protein
MAYADLAAQPGKQSVTIVELRLDLCQNVYGTAPCTAAIGITGADRCYNCRGGCQDSANYNPTTKVYRFATRRVDGIQQPGDGPTFPTLLAVQSAPTILSPGNGLGVRSSLSVTIQDHPWTDSGIDPYLSLRSFDPDERGSFLARFFTRNKYYTNRTVQVLTGYLEDDGTYDVANFQRRTYIITKVSGPSTNGTVTIEGKDPLKLADGEKAQWPPASTATLRTATNELVTTIAIDDPALQITDWWTAGQRYIRVEDEIMLATAISGSATITPSLTVTRATMPLWYDFSLNVATPHAVGATVQACWKFDAKVYDIAFFLLNSVAGIDAAYLPLTEWQAEIDNGFQYLTFHALLTSPVAVKDLLVEMTKLNTLIWWDERASVVRLKGFRFQQTNAADVTDANNIIGESIAVADNTAQITTQAWMFYDMNSPISNPDLPSTYRVTDVRANLDRETAAEFGASYISQTRTRWLNRSDTGTVASIGETMVRQYQDVRKVLTWAMDPKDDKWWTGDTISIATKYIMDENGLATPRNYLITQVDEMMTEAGIRYKYTALEQFAFLRTGVITPNLDGAAPFPDYSAATPLQTLRYAFIAYDDRGDGKPGFLDNTDAYQIE